MKIFRGVTVTPLLIFLALYEFLRVGGVNAQQMCSALECCQSCCVTASTVIGLGNTVRDACQTGCGLSSKDTCGSTGAPNSCGLGVDMHRGVVASARFNFNQVTQDFCCYSDGIAINQQSADCTAVAGAPTPAPTTPAPTTPAPTTPAPTTPAPTTPAPTTPAPTTPAPTTPAPTTPAPTTPAPTTPAPTTPAPTTPAPTTPAPVTPAPVTPAPVTPAPVTPAPVTPAPVTPPPTTRAPVTPAPVTPPPTTPAPVTPPPTTPAPVTPPPTTPAPVTPPPTTPAPVTTSAPPTSTDPPASGEESNNDDSGVLPIIVGVVAVVAIIGVLLAVVVTRRRKPSTSRVPLEEMKTSLYGGNAKDGGAGDVPFADVVYENNAAFGATKLADVKLKPVASPQTGAAAFKPSPLPTTAAAITPKPPTDVSVGNETPKSKKFSPAKKEDDTLSRFELKAANAAVNTSDADPLAAFMPPNSSAQKPVVDEEADDPLSAFILPKSNVNELAGVAPKKSTPGRKSGMPTPGSSKRGNQQKKSFSGMPRPKESAGGVIPKGQKVEAQQQSAQIHPPHEADARISMGYLEYATKNPNRESLFRPSEEYLEKQREQTESAKGKKNQKPAKKPAGKPGNIDDDI